MRRVLEERADMIEMLREDLEVAARTGVGWKRQSTQIRKAIFSVFWRPPNRSIPRCSKRSVDFVTIDVWIKRRLMVG